MKRSTFVAVTVVCVLLAASGGSLLMRSGRPASTGPAPNAGAVSEPAPAKQAFTCSMHPQIRLDQPGDCPICEMPLIPAATATTAAGEAPSLRLSEHALAMASVETVAVARRPLTRELRAVGRIEYNESSLASITPRVDGYAERLFVNFTGVQIRRGDHLAEVYSPELLVAQQELLIALQGGAGGSLADVAKARLRLLGLTDEQIDTLIERKQPTERVTLYSPISGTVIEKSIVEKAAFSAGDILFRIANLETVWVYLEVYEYDLPWVRYGQKVRLTAEAIPGRTFEGLVTFVQPVVNDQSRTVRIPVHIENKDQSLKPGMFVTAVIESALTSEGHAAPTGVEGKHTCPMHPQVLEESDGACPICEMPLEQIPEERKTTASGSNDEAHHHHHAAADAEKPSLAQKYFCPMKCEGEKTYDQPGRCPVCRMKLTEAPPAPSQAGTEHGDGVLAVPVSAVLDSGTRKLVYVEKSRGLFEPREVVLAAGRIVLPGALRRAAGERVVTRGNFLIDSQFQVTGHPSLFYPGGLHATTGHDHGSGAEATHKTAPNEDAPRSNGAPAAGHKH